MLSTICLTPRLLKKGIFEGYSFKFKNLRLVLGMALNFYSSVAKGL